MMPFVRRVIARLEEPGIDAPRVRIDVHEDRLSTDIAHGVGGCDVGQRGNEDLVPWSYVQSKEGEVKGDRPIAYAHSRARPA